MKPQCIAAVQQAIGRALTAAEIKVLDDSIVDHLRNLSRADPQAYAAMPQNMRLQAAAQLAQQQHLAEAILKKQRASLAVVAQHARLQEMSGGINAGESGARSLGGVLDKADTYIKGVAREYFGNLVDTISAIEPRFLGLIEDTKTVKPFVEEVLNNASGVTGNKVAQQAARAWLDTIEAMRTRFNRAGGDVGRLAYGYLPQLHQASRVRAVAADAWANTVLPLLDRARYVDLSGRQMGDAAVLDMLRQAHETIASDGTNTMTPGQQGTGARANRGSEHRALHFKDADSYLSYNQQFGRGSVFASMQGHITGLGRDIGLTEHFGPNPQNTFAILDDTARKADRGQTGFAMAGVTAKQLWATLSGDAGVVEHQRLADIAQGLRNIEVFGKLQGALLSSINDIGTFFITTRFNRIPFADGVTNILRAVGDSEFANRAGLVSESMITDMNRWAEGNLRDGWTSKVANVTMRVSLLQGWTDIMRRGFSTAMMGALGKISRADWGKLDAGDRARLEAKGVSQAEYQVWQLAAPQDWKGSKMLTPEAIRAVTDAQLMQAHLISQAPTLAEGARVRDRAASRLLGVITDEGEYAVLAPDLHARTIVTMGGQHRGTMGGEIARSVMLFKGFPISMLTRHLSRMRSGPMTAASRVEYAASLITATTVFGALAMQIKDVISGKDPRDMTTPKFWGAALAQGGGAGFAGDLIYQAMGGMQSQSGVSTAANVLSAVTGPVFGSMAEFADLTLGNAGAYLKNPDKDTHFGAEAIRFARSHTPFVNLWYARAALDHAIINDLQELMSPGYLAKMERRVQKDWGQNYYWSPASGTPDRMPDFKAIGGQ